MKLKSATIVLVIFIFFLNFILVGGYFRYFLIPQLSDTIEDNNKQLNQDLEDILDSINQEEQKWVPILDSFAKERNLSIYVENSEGAILFNNDEYTWEKAPGYYATTFFSLGKEIYLIKIYRQIDPTNIPALNNFIIFEIVVILIIICIIFESVIQKFISPIQKLQKSIKNYKFRIQPSRTTGHTEIDNIQNNFVDLVEDLEEEKRKQNRIIASISHDIKTPLTAIMGYSDRLLNVPLTEEKKKGYIEKIHNKSIVLKELTEEFDDYLSCNLKETIKREEVSLDEFLNQIVKDYKEDLKEKNIKLTVQNDFKDLKMKVDSAKLRRVFSNIISNSVRFIDKKGKIQIRVKKIDRYLEFIISDNGKGVPDKDLNKIFEPLFTSDPSRKISGLGLSICKEIVENHGGYIYAKNNSEKGLDVIFTIEMDS